MDLTPRFVFHGHACAYSGRLYRPEDITIPSPASSALSVAGGRVRRRWQAPAVCALPDRWGVGDVCQWSVHRPQAGRGDDPWPGAGGNAADLDGGVGLGLRHCRRFEAALV